MRTILIGMCCVVLLAASVASAVTLYSEDFEAYTDTVSRIAAFSPSVSFFSSCRRS